MRSADIDIPFLKEMANRVHDTIAPYIGTPEGAEEIERGAGGDMSMRIDLLAEKVVIQMIEEAQLDILLISEELGEKYFGKESDAPDNQAILIVDPVDGSLNASRGIPFCSVSIALARGKGLEDITLAVIMDLTTRDVYWAKKNEGAYWNDRKIHVSNKNLNDNVVFELDASKTDAPLKMREHDSIFNKIYKLRVMGSLALSLCLLARGTLDGYINITRGTRIVDMAAGYLIINEAGGKTFSMNGKELNPKLSLDTKIPLIACNAQLEPFLRKELSK